MKTFPFLSRQRDAGQADSAPVRVDGLCSLRRLARRAVFQDIFW
jgi:hypothetical protein